MAMAATNTLVQSNEFVELGDIDPEHVVTPGIFVNRIIEIKNPQQESALVKEGVIYP
jgi:3-oxoadipate CoA-transferase alpha subunit